MNYYYNRMFLLETDIAHSGSRITRNAFLKQVFDNRIDFEVNESKYVYIKIDDIELNGKKYIVGRIGKANNELISKPPEEEFAESSQINWKATNIVIDINSDPNGQFLVIQSAEKMAFPLTIAKSMTKLINDQNERFGWIIETNAVSEEGDFWKIANQYKGNISSVEFTFVTPNIFQLKNTLNEELTEAREMNNAEKLKASMSNSQNKLDIEQDNIRQGVDYISRGGGDAKIFSHGKIVYNSENLQKRVAVKSNEPITKANKSFHERLIKTLFK